MSMGTSWIFLYEAYQQIGVSMASLSYYTGPVIVVVLSLILFHEKFTWPSINGFTVVVIGIFLVKGQYLQDGRSSRGLFCGVMSAVMYAMMVIFYKKSKKSQDLKTQ